LLDEARAFEPSDNFGPALTNGASLSRWLQVAGDVFGPKLAHHPKYVIGPKFTSIGCLAAESTHAMDPRVGIAWIWREGRIGRFMNDALRRDTELVAPN
jgi:hypothetical protein